MRPFLPLLLLLTSACDLEANSHQAPPSFHDDGGAPETDGGDANDGSEVDGGAATYECAEENPQGCLATGCDDGFTCDTTIGDRPSGCACDEASGTWTCTPDLNGGECVPTGVCAAVPTCDDGEEVHATVSECPADAACREVTLCGATIWCSRGEAPECAGPNPAGCIGTGCPDGFVCDTAHGTRPSACGCDPESGAWTCTADLGGGECVPSP